MPILLAGCVLQDHMAHGSGTYLLLTEQHFMGKVLLFSPMSMSLLGLGLWHRFLWHEV